MIPFPDHHRANAHSFNSPITAHPFRSPTVETIPSLSEKSHLLSASHSRNHHEQHRRRIQAVRKTGSFNFSMITDLSCTSTIDLRLSSAVLTVRFCLFLSSSCLVRTPEIIPNRSVHHRRRTQSMKKSLFPHFPVFTPLSCANASAPRCQALSPISGFIKFTFSKSSGTSIPAVIGTCPSS